MANCKVCGLKIVKDEIACDGICGGVFHATCLKRSAKMSASGITTCSECCDVKPCHVLRLLRGIVERVDAISSDQSFTAEKVNGISSRWSNLEVFSDDLSLLNNKLDALHDLTSALSLNLGSLHEKSHELTLKVQSMANSVDDLHSLYPVCDPPSRGVGGAPAALALDDIRSSLKRVETDLGSWSSVMTESSRLVGSIAVDLKRLAPPSGIASPSQQPVNVEHCVDLGTPAPADMAVMGDALTRRKRKSRRRRSGKPVTAAAPMDDTPGASLDMGVDERSSRAADPDLSVDPDPVSSGSPLVVTPSVICGVTLRPASAPKCVFISRIHPDTTEDDIVRHITLRVGAPGSSISCRKITPVHRQSGCSFTASFKVLIPDSLFSAITDPNIWPANSIVREFVPRARPGSLSSGFSSRGSRDSKNSSARSQSTMPT